MTVDYLLKRRRANNPFKLKAKCKVCGFGPTIDGLDTEFRFSDVCGRYECRRTAGVRDNIALSIAKDLQLQCSDKKCEICKRPLWPYVKNRPRPFMSLARMNCCPNCAKIRTSRLQKIRRSGQPVTV